MNKPAPAPPCSHKHLKFRAQGRVLSCIDCPRSYHIMVPGGNPALPGGVPDVGYVHPTLGEIDTRHSSTEPPRLAPLPKKPEPRKK